MNREIEVLDANQAFYRAFAARDANALDALWARRAPVACVHPGWDVLDGRTEVVESFRAILESSSAPNVRCTEAQAHLLGEVAFVTCHELVSGARLVAVNLFVREDGAWRLVHHQATPLAPGQLRRQPAESAAEGAEYRS
jgi:ketosteroid isomerase-like protein